MVRAECGKRGKLVFAKIWMPGLEFDRIHVRDVAVNGRLCIEHLWTGISTMTQNRIST